MSQLEAFQQQASSSSFYPHQQQQQIHQPQHQPFFGAGGNPASSTSSSVGSPQTFARGQTPTGLVPQNRFQQPSHQPPTLGRDGSFHGYNNYNAGPAGFNQQQQQQQQQFNQQRQFQQISVGPNVSSPYTPAGFSQPVSASSGTPMSQVFQQQVASPNQSYTSSPTPAGQNRPANQTGSNAKTSMPASSTPQSPQTANGTSQPQSPTSTASLARDQDRVALLLDINADLLTEISILQSQGKGGAHNPQQQEVFRQKGQSDKMASPEYIQALFRLQANLGYLAGRSDMAAKNSAGGGQGVHPPNFMRAPPGMLGLEAKYAKLRELFPGWKGRDEQLENMRRSSAGSAGGQSQQQQQQQQQQYVQ